MITYYIWDRIRCAWIKVTTSLARWASLPHLAATGNACRAGAGVIGLGLLPGAPPIPPSSQPPSVFIPAPSPTGQAILIPPPGSAFLFPPSGSKTQGMGYAPYPALPIGDQMPPEVILVDGHPPGIDQGDQPKPVPEPLPAFGLWALALILWKRKVLRNEK